MSVEMMDMKRKFYIFIVLVVVLGLLLPTVPTSSVQRILSVELKNETMPLQVLSLVYITLTAENYDGLNTCPAGDAGVYQYVVVTCTNDFLDPVPGIPAGGFEFTVRDGGAVWHDDLACSFIAVDPETNAQGQIRFEVESDTSIVGDILIDVTVMGVPSSNSAVMSCKSFDYNTDGTVGLSDFVVFASEYGENEYRSDFTWDGTVGLADFVVFAQHYSHYYVEKGYDFLIIAHPTWFGYAGQWSLQTLAQWHNTNDTLRTIVVNLADIVVNNSFWVNGAWGDGDPNNPYKRFDEDLITNYGMFNDTQAKVRNYIRYAHREFGVGYVLLVGDHEHIPCRLMYAHGEGAPAPERGYNENVPADMYFGCLWGTWNDDEDTFLASGAGWGENATRNTDNGVDEADWTWEVAVGRLCPGTTAELSNAVRKTISYMNLQGNEPYLSTIALAGHYTGWGGQAEWGANYSKQLNGTVCTDWGHTTYGFNPSVFKIKVVDANPNRKEGVGYTDANARGLFNTGVHIWYQNGHGSTTSWVNGQGYGDAFDISDVQALVNTNYCLVFSSIPCSCGQFDTTDCLAEAFVNDEYGAFASIMNSRYGWGSYDDLHSTNHFHGREFFDAYFHEHITRVGDMLADACHDCGWLLAEDDPGTIRWALFEKNLIGSPAVALKLPTVIY